MTIFEAGDRLKEIITMIRKHRVTYKMKDIFPVVIEIKENTEEELLFWYHTRRIIEKQCKVELKFISYE